MSNLRVETRRRGESACWRRSRGCRAVCCRSRVAAVLCTGLHGSESGARRWRASTNRRARARVGPRRLATACRSALLSCCSSQLPNTHILSACLPISVLAALPPVALPPRPTPKAACRFTWQRRTLPLPSRAHSSLRKSTSSERSPSSPVSPATGGPPPLVPPDSFLAPSRSHPTSGPFLPLLLHQKRQALTSLSSLQVSPVRTART